MYLCVFFKKPSCHFYCIILWYLIQLHLHRQVQLAWLTIGHRVQLARATVSGLTKEKPANHWHSSRAGHQLRYSTEGMESLSYPLREPLMLPLTQDTWKHEQSYEVQEGMTPCVGKVFTIWIQRWNKCSRVCPSAAENEAGHPGGRGESSDKNRKRFIRNVMFGLILE